SCLLLRSFNVNISYFYLFLTILNNIRFKEYSLFDNRHNTGKIIFFEHLNPTHWQKWGLISPFTP
ncbi:hypothetical protein D6E02_09045, partial [Moraxella catarrhalis]|uniref:hypothetical protein n=1 Tax=Moraxella catarrhalis TaxID=480 RepID=UPI000ED5F12A